MYKYITTEYARWLSLPFVIWMTEQFDKTLMGKPFGKKPAHWLRTAYAERFIRTYAVIKNRITADLVIVKQGGNNKLLQGTWMHRDIAKELARWLHPAFVIWCDDRIIELLP